MTASDGLGGTARSLLIDPSVLLSRRGLEWLASRGSNEAGIVISRGFKQALLEYPDRELRRFLHVRDSGSYPRRRDRLLRLTEDIPTFSYRDVLLANSQMAAIQEGLLGLFPEGEVLADEWAFLQSNSWLVSANRRVLAAFRNAGAVIVEFGRKALDDVIRMSVPERDIPETLTSAFLAKVGGKWVVAGGSLIWLGITLGPLAGPAGLAAPVLIQAFDP